MRSRAEVITYLGSDDYRINKNTMDQALTEVFDRVHPKVTITAAAEATNARAVTVQFSKTDGTALGEKIAAHFWISDAAAGAECAVAPNGNIAYTTGTLLKAITANKQAKVITDATGKFVITVTETTAKTFYFNVVVNGEVTSLELAFA